MLLIIFYIFFSIITQILTYKLIKLIDKKERKKLQKWELNYIKNAEEIVEKIKNQKKEEDLFD